MSPEKQEKPAGLCDHSLRGQDLNIKGAAIASNFAGFFDVLKFVMSADCYPNILVAIEYS